MVAGGTQLVPVEASYDQYQMPDLPKMLLLLLEQPWLDRDAIEADELSDILLMDKGSRFRAPENPYGRRIAQPRRKRLGLLSPSPSAIKDATQDTA